MTNARYIKLGKNHKGANEMRRIKQTICSKKYTFYVFKESTNSWYANADDNHGDFHIFKWTTDKTKKAVIQTINDFIN